ncbi:hypothetical protein BRD00_14950 [Halobacteriales archaeon QS_8_69_26]|nr:MAG: hypothetical protein BRD00_14950 [Halobacteriales archaeon QS_8_69_26]
MSERTVRSPDPGKIQRVRDHTLPPAVSGVVDEYDARVGDRDRFLWKWAHHLFPKFTLSSVPDGDVEPLRDRKLLGLIFVSVLDDVAEKCGDRITFEEATKVPFDDRSVNHDREGVDREALSFLSDVWDRFAPGVADGPRAGEFEDVFQFDFRQVLNAIDYSYVGNQDLEFVNGSELRTYESHNMMVFAFADIDLIHSPSFDRSDLSTLRRVLERAQRMVRIGNWITTWERELREGDFTSGVVVYARENGIVSAEELRGLREDPDEAAVAAVASAIRDEDVEDVFMRRWQRELTLARRHEGATDSVDVGAYLDGVETVMEYHLASRGLK